MTKKHDQAVQHFEILVQRDGMTYDEADEFFEVNCQGAYAGDQTPAYLVWDAAKPH